MAHVPIIAAASAAVICWDALSNPGSDDDADADDDNKIGNEVGNNTTTNTTTTTNNNNNNNNNIDNNTDEYLIIDDPLSPAWTRERNAITRQLYESKNKTKQKLQPPPPSSSSSSSLQPKNKRHGMFAKQRHNNHDLQNRIHSHQYQQQQQRGGWGSMKDGDEWGSIRNDNNNMNNTDSNNNKESFEHSFKMSGRTAVHDINGRQEDENGVEVDYHDDENDYNYNNSNIYDNRDCSDDDEEDDNNRRHTSRSSSQITATTSSPYNNFGYVDGCFHQGVFRNIRLPNNSNNNNNVVKNIISSCYHVAFNIGSTILAVGLGHSDDTDIANDDADNENSCNVSGGGVALYDTVNFTLLTILDGGKHYINNDKNRNDVNDDGYDESSAVSAIQWTNSHNINTNSGTGTNKQYLAIGRFDGTIAIHCLENDAQSVFRRCNNKCNGVGKNDNDIGEVIVYRARVGSEVRSLVFLPSLSELSMSSSSTSSSFSSSLPPPLAIGERSGSLSILVVSSFPKHKEQTTMMKTKTKQNETKKNIDVNNDVLLKIINENYQDRDDDDDDDNDDISNDNNYSNKNNACTAKHMGKGCVLYRVWNNRSSGGSIISLASGMTVAPPPSSTSTSKSISISSLIKIKGRRDKDNEKKKKNEREYNNKKKVIQRRILLASGTRDGQIRVDSIMLRYDDACNDNYGYNKNDDEYENDNFYDEGKDEISGNNYSIDYNDQTQHNLTKKGTLIFHKILYQHRRSGANRALTFTAGYTRLFAGGYDKTVYVIDCTNWKVLGGGMAVDGSVCTIGVDPEERYITIGTRGRTLTIHDSSTYRPIKVLRTAGWVSVSVIYFFLLYLILLYVVVVIMVIF